MRDDAVVCRRLKEGPVDLADECPSPYDICEPLPFRQWWKGEEARPAEGGVARVGYDAHHLRFHVLMTDSDIFSRAERDNDKLWELGDVVEFFMKPGGGRDDYWEVHVSPNDFLMDLRFPSRDKFKSGEISWDEVIAPSCGGVKNVLVSADENHWAVEFRMPWTAFGLANAPETKDVWSFAVCRYNYSTATDAPELSSTVKFLECHFHRIEDYAKLRFEG